MAKVWGLNIPEEFSAAFNNFLKLDWQNGTQKVKIADYKPGKITGLNIANRSQIPDFISDWWLMSEVRQSKWSYDWGSGFQQAFGLFFQNQFYRVKNGLAVKSTPNFFKAPACCLHITPNDYNISLNFAINSGDYVLSDPSNILHIQEPIQCVFSKAYSFSCLISAKIENLYSEDESIIKVYFTQYYENLEGAQSRSALVWQDLMGLTDFTIEASKTFTKESDDEVITGFKIEILFPDTSGDFWFYNGQITAVDNNLGAVRLHNTISLKDVGENFTDNLKDIKNQWSISNNDANSFLEKKFPYSNEYPEEPNNIFEIEPNRGDQLYHADGGISETGEFLISAINGGRLWLSSNYAISWSETRPAGDVDKNWNCCAISGDGQKILAGISSGRLYVSTDGGANWSETRPAGDVDKNWKICAISNDGSKIIAGVYGGRLYVSTDGGANWSETRPAGDVDKNWHCCAISGDGQKILTGVGTSGRLYVSTDGGANWSETRPAGDANKSWRGCGISSNGNTMLAGDWGNGRLWLSTDGANWSETRPAGDMGRYWQAIAVSGNGQILIAGIWGGRLYISTNAGTNWAEIRPNGDWNIQWNFAKLNYNNTSGIIGGWLARLWHYFNG